MVERAQKTIQNYLVAYEMNNDNFDFFKAIPQITELYNAKLNLSDDLSPYERIFSTKSPTYIAKFHNIDLEQENLKIAKLRKQILKKRQLEQRFVLQQPLNNIQKTHSVKSSLPNSIIYMP